VTSTVTGGARRLLAAAAGGLLSAPGLALACPTCATRDAPGLALLAAVGGMIAIPYVVAVVAIKVVRKLEREG
jgi:hypothetical protein